MRFHVEQFTVDHTDSMGVDRIEISQCQDGDREQVVYLTVEQVPEFIRALRRVDALPPTAG